MLCAASSSPTASLSILDRASGLTLCAAAVVVVALGCSESKGNEHKKGAAGGEELIRKLPRVDVSKLDPDARKAWVEHINNALSPCGEPITVARCVQQQRKCRRCVPAARYLARLVTGGYSAKEIRQFYRNRYDEQTKVDLPTGSAPVRGATMARIRIVEFSDFECPFCKAARPILERTLREFPGRVQIVFRHYPLPAHTQAVPAAIASIAAAKQGKFWEMHDKLFDAQSDLSSEALERYAEELGLDMDRFRTAIQKPETREVVEKDRALGQRVKVDGTPTIFVSGRRFDEPLESLADYIREELNQ